MVTILSELGETSVAGAAAEGEALWIPAAQLEAATAWSLRPEGFCHEALCVPIPARHSGDYVRGAAVNVAALWRLLSRPVLHSRDSELWVLGAGAQARRAQLESLQAPDFRLPDLEGRMHGLSEQRGRKVLLVSWASW